jgi:hypothetical protein
VDVSRFLPLSNRPHDDESAVTSDRRAAIAELVDEARRLTASASPELARLLTDDFIRDARLIPDARAAGSTDLTALAAAVRDGKRRRTGTLVRAVRALLVLGDQLSVAPRISGLTLGTVALYLATSAPLERRAVVMGHAIRATDADWQFGRGPVLEGPALQIVRFLIGLSNTPPRPASKDD